MIQKVRRVVTGHDAQGRSMILSDGPASNAGSADASRLKDSDAGAGFKAIGAGHVVDPASHEIYAVLDKGETLLKAGDVAEPLK